MREAIANKTHYQNGITLLDRQFEELFTHEQGPGALPTKIGDGEPVQAVIVPHSPYPVAGANMAWAYKALSEGAVNDKLFIIVAQAQHSTAAGTTMETFLTPYGEVRTDQHFIRELLAKGNIQLNDEAHAKESCIEIQLPFLQYVFKRHSEQIKIVPLLLNTETDVAALSVDIKETLLEQNKEATFIFVSNLTSYGRDFHYVPFTEHIPENIAKQDKELIQALQHRDKDVFDTALAETLTPVSGRSALDLYFKYFSKGSVELEHYYISGDITGDYKNCVSYGSFVLKFK